ncbi:NB-ARC domain-containing protein, partial [Amycolatopsis keratiniphila]
MNLHAVSGMAGVGKTTLCIRAAHLLENYFPGGNLFLELHGHTPGRKPVSPGDALDSLLLAAGVDLSTLPPKLDDRARIWRQRINGTHALLIFDDAADHDQVRPLMPGTPTCLVLITSRHRLAGLDGVAPMALHPMPTEDARQLLLRSADRPSQLSDDEAVAEIVGRFCGHLPMAISIVGARLRDHPRWNARHIADQLADDHERLNGLQAGDLSVPGAFAMSFRAMPADRRRLFQLLGVHPGPEFDAYAVAALLGSDRAAASRGLDDLYTDNLIMETTPGRYQLHDLLRDYAITLAEGLTDADRRQALDRVLNYYLHAALDANSYLPRYQALTMTISTTPVDTPYIRSAAQACQWFAIELSTLTTCATRAAAAGQPHRTVHLSAVLSAYLRVMSLTEQGVRLHNTALDAATRIHDRLGQGYALNYLGVVQRLWGELDAAKHNHQHALELFEQAGDRLGQGYALNDLGRVLRLEGAFDAAK